MTKYIILPAITVVIILFIVNRVLEKRNINMTTRTRVALQDFTREIETIYIKNGIAPPKTNIQDTIKWILYHDKNKDSLRHLETSGVTNMIDFDLHEMYDAWGNVIQIHFTPPNEYSYISNGVNRNYDNGQNDDIVIKLKL